MKIVCNKSDLVKGVNIVSESCSSQNNNANIWNVFLIDATT